VENQQRLDTLAKIDLRMYPTRKFNLDMTLLTNDHEPEIKNEDLYFKGTWEESKSDFILKFTGQKHLIVSLFDKKYVRTMILKL